MPIQDMLSKEDFKKLHQQRSRDVLEKPIEELFAIKAVSVQPPQKARIEPSKPCERCGEPTMASKLVWIDGALICKACRQ